MIMGVELASFAIIKALFFYSFWIQFRLQFSCIFLVLLLSEPLDRPKNSIDIGSYKKVTPQKESLNIAPLFS